MPKITGMKWFRCLECGTTIEFTYVCAAHPDGRIDIITERDVPCAKCLENLDNFTIACRKDGSLGKNLETRVVPREIGIMRRP